MARRRTSKAAAAAASASHACALVPLVVLAAVALLAPVALGGSSEFGQDDWVLSLFPDKKGYYVDVGAWHTELASNSKALDDAGWGGLCVDPSGSGFDQRGCTFEPHVVSDYPGQLLKFYMAGPFSGVRSTMTDRQWEDYRAEFQKGSLRVRSSTTLGELLRKHGAPGQIDYLSVDVEGHELQVLKGIPFWRYTFGAITVDHNNDERARRCVTALLQYHGYSLAHEMGQDMGFVRNATQPRPEQVDC